jgi:hypothetical protein
MGNQFTIKALCSVYFQFFHQEVNESYSREIPNQDILASCLLRLPSISQNVKTVVPPLICLPLGNFTNYPKRVTPPGFLSLPTVGITSMLSARQDARQETWQLWVH